MDNGTFQRGAANASTSASTLNADHTVLPTRRLLLRISRWGSSTLGATQE
jgi:hypothetical protein